MSDDTLSLVVASARVEGQGVLVADLVAADGGALPAFAAGAHVDLYLGNGLIRQYSLCGDPADHGRYRVGILKDPNSKGGSVAAHRLLTEGATVQVGRPRNLFPLSPDARHTLLIGGGIGVTPMIAMAHALNAQGASFALRYCARTRPHAAFLDELAQAPFADRVALSFDDEAPADMAAILSGLPAGTHVYVCGPNGFMDWVIGLAGAAGIPAANIHREYFTAEISTSGTSFELVAAKSGKSVQVGADETMIQALARIGIKIEVKCEKGVCGTCLCTVLEGEPDHRDVYLTDEEKADNDQVLLCCSRAKSSSLVIDL